MLVKKIKPKLAVFMLLLTGIMNAQIQSGNLSASNSNKQNTNANSASRNNECGLAYFFNYNPNFNTFPSQQPDGYCSSVGLPVCSITICCESNFVVVPGFFNTGGSGQFQYNVPGPYHFIVYPSGGNPTYTVVNNTTNLDVTPIPFPYASGTTYTINAWDYVNFPNFNDQPVDPNGCRYLEVTSLCHVPGSYTLSPNPTCINTPVCFTFSTVPNANQYPLITFNNPPISSGLQSMSPFSTPPYGYFSCQSYANPGSYSGSYTTQYGTGTQAKCVTTTPFTTIVNPPTGNLTAQASPPFICSGQQTTLTANVVGSNSYTWYPGGSTGYSLAVNPLSTTIYTVIAGSCPQRTAYVTVEVGSCCTNPARGSLTFNNVTLVGYGNANAIAWSSLSSINNPYSNVNIALPSNGIVIGNYAVNGYLQIQAPTTFSHTNIYFGDNAVVNQNAFTTIDKSYWHGCNWNWQGIKSNNLFSLTNSVIEDAGIALQINAAFSVHSGVNIDNTIFNKNAYGILYTGALLSSFRVTGSIFTSRDIPAANYVYTSGSRWTSLSNFNTTALAAYSTGYLKGSTPLNLPNTVRGQVGIYFGGASKLINGNPGGDIYVGDISTTPSLNTDYTNVFDYLRIGVYNSNSKTVLYNNYFQIISSIPSIDYYGNASACSYNNTTPKNTLGANPTAVQGSGPYKNVFSNSTIGVYGSSNGTLSVINNQFSDIVQYGVQIENWNASGANTSTVEINNNSFNKCLYDLYATNNVTVKLRFYSNLSTYPFVAVKPKVTYHAYISESGNPTTAKYNLGFNNSTGKVTGIYSNYTYSPAIVNNTITVRTPIGAGFNAPIWLDFTNLGDIKSNILNVNPSNSHSWNTFGIFTNVGNNNLFCDNNIKGAGACLKFQGNSPSRIYLNKLNVNPSDPCLFGILLDNFCTNVGVIKYSTNSRAENEFGDFDYPAGGADTRTQNNSIGFGIHYTGANSSANNNCPFLNLNDVTSTAFSKVINNTTSLAQCSELPGNGARTAESNESATVTELEIVKTSILVYPNPANSSITVSTNIEGAKLFLYNLVGQILIEIEVNNENKIDVSALQNGTYIYKIMKANELVKCERLIINK